MFGVHVSIVARCSYGNFMVCEQRDIDICTAPVYTFLIYITLQNILFLHIALYVRHNHKAVIATSHRSIFTPSHHNIRHRVKRIL